MLNVAALDRHLDKGQQKGPLLSFGAARGDAREAHTFEFATPPREPAPPGEECRYDRTLEGNLFPAFEQLFERTCENEGKQFRRGFRSEAFGFDVCLQLEPEEAVGR